MLVLGIGATKGWNQVLEPADCPPPTAVAIMNFNNVRALIENGGLMWQNRSTSQAFYEVPAGGGVSSIYAGSFWAGGVTPSGQLKLAANTFGGQGGDYSAGPLVQGGVTNAENCIENNQIFSSYREDVAQHQAYHDALVNGTVSELFPNGYVMPDYFNSWPAHGSVGTGQDVYLAPFLDRDGDGEYHPEWGDAPGFDLDGVNCNAAGTGSFLRGDANWFWVFNDAGRVHAESGGEPMGLEIRAQAWAFEGGGPDFDHATFYTYEMLNQGPFVLHDFYAAIWVDADVGTATDDYVGCDVSRGLAFAYNGNEIDGPSSSSPGYGENPPAVGLDFFYGLYQDADSADNPLTSNLSDALAESGIPYSGLGFGYGDGIIDNERLGMSRFVYYNNSGNQVNGEPTAPAHFYNYMKGIWKNGQTMAYGGDGVSASTGAQLDVTTSYMFPGDSDPSFWGTGGQPVDPWTEETSNNPPSDRRFLTSCGPVTMEPGERNEIVFGVLWARGEPGGISSVDALKETDDRVQELFDNCFEGIGCADPLASNYEQDALFDFAGTCTYINFGCGEALPAPYLLEATEVVFEEDTVALDFGVGGIDLALLVPILDSLQIEGASGLPSGLSFSGQEVWLGGSFACLPINGVPLEIGEFISEWTVITWQDGEPSELTLTVTFSVNYSAPSSEQITFPSLPLTRTEGRGSGRKKLRLSPESELALLMSPTGRIGEVTYEPGGAPFDVFLLGDSVVQDDFELSVLSIDVDGQWPIKLSRLSTEEAWIDTLTFEHKVSYIPDWDMAVAYDAPQYASGQTVAEVLGSEVVSQDGDVWWVGLEDMEGFSSLNWIRAGLQEGSGNPSEYVYDDLADPNEAYESFLDGTWAPYSVVSYTATDVENIYAEVVYDYAPSVAPAREGLIRLQQWNTPSSTSSAMVVFTSDSIRWTRCPVLEMQPNAVLSQNATGASGELEKMNLRRHESVDKQGRTVAEGGNSEEALLVSGIGMGWFPGYAIDTQTGERLNMAFGEDSWLTSENGKDMIFNPGSRAVSFPLGQQVYAGGQHWIYLFKNGEHFSGTTNRMPAYDAGQFMMEQLLDPTISNERRVFRDCIWVGSALSMPNHDWSQPWSEFRIHLDVALPLQAYSPSQLDVDVTLGSENNWLPKYRFSTVNLMGCSNPSAVNFDANALLDDGTCVDSSAPCLADSLGLLANENLGFLPSDTLWIGSTEQPELMLIVGGSVEVSSGQYLSLSSATVQSLAGLPEGVSWVGLSVGEELENNLCLSFDGVFPEGCTTVSATFDVEAQFFGNSVQAGSQTFELTVCTSQDPILGCTYEEALNFNVLATFDDESCLFVGCTDEDALNFHPLFSIDDGSCLYDDLASECVGDLDFDGVVGSGDLLLILTKFGLLCDY
jgi:hypothetical protein